MSQLNEFDQAPTAASISKAAVDVESDIDSDASKTRAEDQALYEKIDKDIDSLHESLSNDYAEMKTLLDPASSWGARPIAPQELEETEYAVDALLAINTAVTADADVDTADADVAAVDADAAVFFMHSSRMTSPSRRLIRTPVTALNLKKLAVAFSKRAAGMTSITFSYSLARRE